MATSRRVTRWRAECGKGYWKRTDAEHHEIVCKCWTNPKNRTCKTCKFADYAPYENDTGSGGFFECSSPYVDGIHSGGPKGVDYISVKCVHWKSNK